MRLQRVRDAVNRAEMQFIKWTAEGTFKGLPMGKLSICDAATCVNRRGYACILAMSVRLFPQIKVAPRIFMIIRP